MEINSINKGKAAEYITVSRFLKLGYNVYLPATEFTKVDLIAEKDSIYHKLQVKSFVWGNNSLHIAVRKIGVNSKTNTKVSYYTDTDVDYFAAVDVSTEEVFLIPINIVMQYKSSISKATCYNNKLIMRL